MAAITLPPQIRKSLYVSLGLSFIIFIFSLASNLGDNSFFIDPIASVLTVIQHLTLFWLNRSKRRLFLQSRRSKYPQYPLSSLIPSIICFWLLGFLWTISSALIVFNAVFIILDSYSNRSRAVVLIEPLFAASEAILLLTIAVLCTKHREAYQQMIVVLDSDSSLPSGSPGRPS
ncbi:hypothetical protein BDP27DRAFT_1321857 [Rhodocollybia butyracea]|uniref:Uncharacterized protein n=1 Tax=Rhodocollybia butyracea TaxID=206335 RepID=A0A9P5PYJ0_9AGAR|nr:hypothetical protein BDP27DRAFT_1321857 [Rhodocollybia butyracea]